MAVGFGGRGAGERGDRRVRVQGEPVDSYPRAVPEGVRGEMRRVTVVGEEVLHRPCREVVDFGTPELGRLVDDMFATLDVCEGAGLAANQVGVDLALFVWDCTDEWGVRHVGHLVNPVLEEPPTARRSLAEEAERCLSVPGPYRVVPRPDHAVARGFDKEGRELVIDGRGYFARCLQHEADHLHGRVYVDRLTRRERSAVLREMAESRDEVLARRAARAGALGK